MLIIAAYVLLGVALVIGNGTRPGLPYAILAALALLVAVRRGLVLATRALPWAVAAGCLTAIDPLGTEASTPVTVLIVIQGAVGIAGLLRPNIAGRATLGAALAVYALSGAVVIRSLPPPRIDVFDLQQGGAIALEHGQNPYAVTYPNAYSAAETRAFFGDERTELREYPYPPLTLLATTAAHAMAGDVRWAFLAAQVGVGGLLFALARGAGQTPSVCLALTTLHFLHPRGLYVLDRAWTDPAVACAFLAVLWLLQQQRTRGLGLALGLFVAAKQYSILALPFLAKDARIRGRTWLGAAATACLVTLPFFVWSPRDFVEDVLLFQLRQPFRPEAISIPAFVAAATGWKAPGALALLGPACVGVFTWSRLGPATPRGQLPLVTALGYASFFLLAKQAFSNYYYMVGVIILAAAALAGTPPPIPAPAVKLESAARSRRA